MWFVIEMFHYVSTGSDEVEGLYGPYASYEDAEGIVRSMEALDRENEWAGNVYKIMSPKMF